MGETKDALKEQIASTSRDDVLYNEFISTLKKGDDTIGHFLELGVDVNRLTDEGVAPIFYATGNQVQEIDKKFGDKIDWDIKNGKGLDLVMNAIDNYDLDPLYN